MLALGCPVILKPSGWLSRKRVSALAGCILVFTSGFLRSASLAEKDDYQAALRALADGLPQVAAVKLERIVKDPGLDNHEATAVCTKLVDALIRSRQPERALVALTLLDVPDAKFWKSQALLLQGRLRESEWLLREYLSSSPSSALEEYARLALGQVIIAEGRENTGRKEIREVMDSRDVVLARIAQIQVAESETMSGRSDMAERRMEKMDPNDLEACYVRARALMENGKWSDAERNLHWIRVMARGEPQTERLLNAARVKLAEVFLSDGRAALAGERLRGYIERNPSGPFLDQMFALLERVGSSEGSETVETVRRWASAESPATLRREFAQFYLAKFILAAGKQDDVVRLLEDFVRSAPDNPRHGEALRLLMTVHGAQHHDERVLELAREWQKRYGAGGRDTVDFLTGMISFSRRDFDEAAVRFLNCAEAAADAVLRRRSLFNLGIAALAGADENRFAEVVSKIGDAKDAETSAAALEFERAMHLASRRDNGAEEALREFVRKHAGDAKCGEAQVAVAEICLLDLPPRPKAARAALDAALQTEGASDELKERIAYTEVWLQEADENLKGVTESGEAFLRQWPKAARADEVLMRVAQAWYRLEEYPKARVKFEALADEYPGSAYAEVAQYFAARSAMATLNKADLEKAMDIFGEVVDRKGALVLESRRQMARVKRLQGDEMAAMSEIEAILGAKEPPKGEDVLALLLEKGELHLLLARRDPKHLDEAVAVFRDIAHAAANPRYWRMRAGVFLAQSHQRLAHGAEALEACYDVIDLCASKEPVPQMSSGEQTWFYRAGFLALDLLESQKQWESAARLADRMVKIGGSRAQEAKERANRIRLEHFIWDK